MADFITSWWYQDILHVRSHVYIEFKGVADLTCYIQHRVTSSNMSVVGLGNTRGLWVILYYIKSYNIILYHIISYYIKLYHTKCIYIMLYYIIVYHIVYYIILCYVILYYIYIYIYIILYHFISYNIILYIILYYNIIIFFILYYVILFICLHCIIMCIYIYILCISYRRIKVLVKLHCRLVMVIPPSQITNGDSKN